MIEKMKDGGKEKKKVKEKEKGKDGNVRRNSELSTSGANAVSMAARPPTAPSSSRVKFDLLLWMLTYNTNELDTRRFAEVFWKLPRSIRNSKSMSQVISIRSDRNILQHLQEFESNGIFARICSYLFRPEFFFSPSGNGLTSRNDNSRQSSSGNADLKKNDATESNSAVTTNRPFRSKLIDLITSIVLYVRFKTKVLLSKII